MRSLLLSTCTMAVLCSAGCGPMGKSPLPPQLDAKQQEEIDQAWDRALTPVDRLDRQAFLDALILTQGYQAGVDRLTFRSEKSCATAIVVMEIHIDRARPVDDRFEITIRDKKDEKKILQQFVYTRNEVEVTVRELSNSKYTCEPNPNAPALEPWEARKRDEVKNRLAAVEQIFPKRDDEPEEQGKK